MLTNVQICLGLTNVVMFCLTSHRHQPLPISPDTTHHNMPWNSKACGVSATTVSVMLVFIARSPPVPILQAPRSVQHNAGRLVRGAWEKARMRARLKTHTAVDCGAWCLVESRELAGVCRISMHLYTTTNLAIPLWGVVCGVWEKVWL